MSNFPGQSSYSPYDQYSGPQYPYMGGYRNYMPSSPYAQNQPFNGQNQGIQNNQQLPAPQPNNNIQFALIPNIEVAEKSTAEKNQTIYMMNQNKPEIYAKAADNFGLQTMRYFKLVEFNPNLENQQQQTTQQNIEYIPREEFNRFVAVASAEIETLKQNIQTIQQPAQNPINISTPAVTATAPEPTPQVTPTQPSASTKKTSTTKDSK